MATLNFGSFFDGYAQQQGVELRDAEEARRRQQAAQAQTLFDQQQATFNQEAALRDLRIRNEEQRLRGGMELFTPQHAEAMARANFNLQAGNAVRTAQIPTLTEVAEAAAAAQRQRALTAQTQAGVDAARTNIAASLFGNTAYTDALTGAALTTAQTAQTQAEVDQAKVGVQAGLYGDQQYTGALSATARNTAAAAENQSALQFLLSQDAVKIQQDPVARSLAEETAKLKQYGDLLNAAMQNGRMDIANRLLQPQGLEAAFEGGVPVVRQIGTEKWAPFAAAMSLPFYKDLTANLERAARAHLSGARADTLPAGQQGAPAAALLAPPTAPTPIAGRGAPATPAAPAAVAPTKAAPPPVAPPPPAGPPDPVEVLGAQLDAAKAARQAAWDELYSFGGRKKLDNPEGVPKARAALAAAQAEEARIRREYEALVNRSFLPPKRPAP